MSSRCAAQVWFFDTAKQGTQANSEPVGVRMVDLEVVWGEGSTRFWSTRSMLRQNNAEHVTTGRLACDFRVFALFLAVDFLDIPHPFNGYFSLIHFSLAFSDKS